MLHKHVKTVYKSQFFSFPTKIYYLNFFFLFVFLSGPVLDAVATLLRGPIRSAIANRRSEFLKRSDDPVGGFNKIKATRRVTLPKVARERGQEPNFIPVGNHQNNPFLRQNQSPQQVYESQPQVIPLRNFPPEQRNNNGNILQALPRKDTEGELEYIGMYAF